MSDTQRMRTFLSYCALATGALALVSFFNLPQTDGTTGGGGRGSNARHLQKAAHATKESIRVTYGEHELYKSQEGQDKWATGITVSSLM